MNELPSSQKLQKTTWVETFERKWIEALLAGQVTELFNLCAAEFRLVTHVGDVLNRERFVSAMEARRLVFNAINVVEQDIQIVSQTALVTRTWKMSMSFNGLKFDGIAVMSAVWLEQPKGDWKCALIHSTDARLRESWKQLTSKPV